MLVKIKPVEGPRRTCYSLPPPFLFAYDSSFPGLYLKRSSILYSFMRKKVNCTSILNKKEFEKEGMFRSMMKYFRYFFVHKKESK